MPLILTPADVTDLPQILPMLLQTYSRTSATVNALYPHTLSPIDSTVTSGAPTAISRLQHLTSIDPTVRWLKVTDTETGEIVSASQWNIYKDEDGKRPLLGEGKVVLDGPEGSWEGEREKRYAEEMLGAFLGPRGRRWREVGLPVISLNIMGTAKAYRYRGAASMQVKEFNRIADDMNALITTESTTAARWLYEKHGYVVSKDSGHYVVEAKSDEFAGRPKDRLFFMERPRAR